MVRTLLDGELSKTSEFGRILDKHLLKLAPLVAIRASDAGLAQNGLSRFNKSRGAGTAIYGLSVSDCLTIQLFLCHGWRTVKNTEWICDPPNLLTNETFRWTRWIFGLISGRSAWQ